MVSTTVLAPAFAFAQQGNFKVGPVLLDLTGWTGATYSSNITSSTVDARPDLMLRLGTKAEGNWAVSKNNDLSFGIGVELRKYLENPELDSTSNMLTLTPDTRVQFTIFAGEFRFIVSDQLTFSSDPTDSVAVNPDNSTLQLDVLEYSRLVNQARLAVEWQMNPLWVLQAALLRTDVIPLTSQFESTDRTEHALLASLDRVINSKLTAGVYTTVFRNEYETSFQNGSSGYGFGLQTNWQASDNLTASARYGWRFSQFDSNGRNPDASDFSGVNYSLDLAHAASSLYSHRLSYSRSLDYGFVSNFTLNDTVAYSFTFKGFKRSDINGSLAWQNGRDSGGLSNERYNRLIFHIGLEYALSPKLSWELEYEHSIKNSNAPRRDYVRNDLTLLLRYDF